jgi:hypothetical protein
MSVNNILAGLMIAFGGISLFGVILAFSVLINGWAFWLLWQWFVPSVFIGLPVLTLGQAIGLGMVVSYATYTYVPSKEDDKGSAMILIFRPLLSVLFGFIVKQFI